MPTPYEPETDAALYRRHQKIERLKAEIERETDLLYLGCLENVENGVTVTHLARLLGVSRQWLHRALNGVRSRREQIEADREGEQFNTGGVVPPGASVTFGESPSWVSTTSGTSASG